jgi:hypothetical protein
VHIEKSPEILCTIFPIFGTLAVDKNKIEMYKELYRRYMKQNKGNVGNYTILESIIEEPAPSFYLDAGSFRGIVYRTLGERSLQIV